MARTMIHSFRLRLALLSALLTGLSLAVFGIGTWWLIRDIRIERIDAEVRAHAEREVSKRRSPAEWQRIETALLAGLGVRDNRALLLLVQDGLGEILYRSAHWPAGFDAGHLPWPQRRIAQGRGTPAIALVSAALAADDVPAPADPAHGNDRNPPPRPGPPPNDADDPRAPSRAAPPPQGQPPVSTSLSQIADGRLWRIGLASTDSARIAVAVDAKVIDADMDGIRNAILIALSITLILTGLGGWFFSIRAMRPLKKLVAATQRVTTEGLGQRISTEGEDREFAELIDFFNRMLAQLGSKQAELERMALHDTLTGLPNRKLLLERVQQALTRAQRNAGRVAVLFLDLDGFKQVNDTLGHKAGDEALREMTRRLASVVRQADTLSRLGGDEFVLLVTDLAESDASGVGTLAEKCIAVVAKPLSLQGVECKLGVSIGIAIRYGNCTPDALLAAADKAMYEAKQQGRGRYVIAAGEEDYGAQDSRPGRSPRSAK